MNLFPRRPITTLPAAAPPEFIYKLQARIHKKCRERRREGRQDINIRTSMRIPVAEEEMASIIRERGYNRSQDSGEGI